MGRNKKPIVLKKLEGTYRADRDAEREKVDSVIKNGAVIVPLGLKVSCPKSITDRYVRSYWKKTTAGLISLQLLSYSDIPMLEGMMYTLQKLRAVRAALDECDALNPAQEERFDRLTRLMLKLTSSFNEIAVKFCISPVARSKMTLDALAGEKLQREIKSDNAVGDVLRMREMRRE